MSEIRMLGGTSRNQRTKRQRTRDGIIGGVFLVVGMTGAVIAAILFVALIFGVIRR